MFDKGLLIYKQREPFSKNLVSLRLAFLIYSLDLYLCLDRSTISYLQK